MKYPRIYSLSTVGILKHYNQDYLIHPQRTDFTGSNGVGKSIIADLFQLIFINERQLFQFGTEGYKKEVRQIHKLAYKCRDAYAFLTIEIEIGKFICLGICIPNTNSRPLKPFLITSDPDSSKDFTERGINLDNIPSYKNFITSSGQICNSDEISKNFRNNYGLYFESFSTKDKRDEHYANLYDKHILPINLSVPSSLKAFAKILQSFSRARSEGEKSDALKEFLFDGNEKELEESFDTHKREIEKLLQDFEELQTFITDLESKQETLNELKIIEHKSIESHEDYLLKKTGYYLSSWKKNKSNLEKVNGDYSKYLDKIDKLEIDVPRLKSISVIYKEMHEQSKKKYNAILAAQKLLQEIVELKNRINLLNIENLPLITESFTELESIDNFVESEISKLCKEFLPIYRDYSNLTSIENKLDKQRKIIDERKTQLQNEVDYLKSVNMLFAESDDSSLISQVLKSNIPISIAQEAVLFHFIKTKWQKPDGQIVDFFANGFKFFEEKNIIKDSVLPGYWLCFQDLNIYIKPLSHKPILQDNKIRKKAITEMISNNHILLSQIDVELKSIKAFEQGEMYDTETAQILHDFDHRLNNYKIAKDIKLTIQLVLQLKIRTESLIGDLEIVEQKFSDLCFSENLDKMHDFILLEKITENLIHARERRMNFFKEKYTSDNATLISLKSNILSSLKRELEEKQELEKSSKNDYLKQREKLVIAFENLSETPIVEATETQMREAQDKFSLASTDYKSFYRQACEKYDETKGKRNIELTTEIESENFSFELLERILLGKIHFKDQISEELRSANLTRHNLIDSIHETMLKIFAKTKDKYDYYKRQIRELNLFFQGRKISKKYYFQVDFKNNEEIPITWITQLQSQSQQAFKLGELPLGTSVEVFVQDFFKKAVGYKRKLGFRELLDPRTYFALDAGLSDENGNEVSGSTGETYTAKVLLGIGRLSKVQLQNRPGIRFIILEETANLDKTNFNNFPEIADEFDYQIITMTPKPFGADSDKGWYLHHLLPGKEIAEINYPVPSSYFKTNINKENLLSYLENQKKE